MTLEPADFVCPQCNGIVRPYQQPVPGRAHSSLAPYSLKELVERVCYETVNNVIKRINEHMKTPLDTPLPKGLVFMIGDAYNIITMGNKNPIGGLNVPPAISHTYLHEMIILHESATGFEKPRKSSRGFINSLGFKKSIKSKFFRLPNQKEFDRFLELYNNSRGLDLGLEPEEFRREY